MNGRTYRKFGMALAAASATVIWCAPAKATTLNFNSTYYVSNSSTFNTLFGTTTGYSSAGVYQETNTTTPVVTRLGSSGAPGEFVQNTTPNASQGIQLFGWSGSYNNGTPLANNVYNLGNPYNGTVLYLQYKTGVTGGLFGNGTTTAFNFNGLALRGATTNANLTFTLEGFLGGVLKDSAVLTVTGSTLSTFTENWTGIDTVEFVSTVANPVNWGSGTLYLGSIEYNDPIPEPTAIVLLGSGLVGLGMFRRKLS